MKAIVVFYSRSGNTEKMAHSIATGIKNEGVDTEVRRVDQTSADDLLNFDAIVIGSPTQYGSMAWEVKKFLDDTASKHYKLEGKIGGAFSSSCHIGGGNETTILDILHAMLIHGMIIQGEPMYDHYGATGLNGLGGDTLMKCEKYGNRIGRLVKR